MKCGKCGKSFYTRDCPCGDEKKEKKAEKNSQTAEEIMKDFKTQDRQELWKL